MRLHKFPLIAGVLLAIVCVGTFAYRDVVNPHELTQPITITDSEAWADGGSMTVRVLGANGKKLAVERVGSLDVERSRQAMYVVNDVLGVIPWRRPAGKNSRLEKEAREMLESLLRDSLPLAQRDLLNRNDQNVLQTVPGNVLAVYDLATWISERQQ